MLTYLVATPICGRHQSHLAIYALIQKTKPELLNWSAQVVSLGSQNRVRRIEGTASATMIGLAPWMM